MLQVPSMVEILDDLYDFFRWSWSQPFAFELLREKKSRREKEEEEEAAYMCFDFAFGEKFTQHTSDLYLITDFIWFITYTVGVFIHFWYKFWVS